MTYHKTAGLGRSGEEMVIQLLNNANLEAAKNNDLAKKYDYDVMFKIGKVTKTIEVKFDYMAVKTGNLCLEYHNSKKDEPSGIFVTKADFWCQIILDDTNPTIWISSVKKLKAFIESNTPHKTIKSGGDKNANLFLYRLDDILPVFTRIDNVNADDLLSSLKKVLK